MSYISDKKVIGAGYRTSFVFFVLLALAASSYAGYCDEVSTPVIKHISYNKYNVEQGSVLRINTQVNFFPCPGGPAMLDLQIRESSGALHSLALLNDLEDVPQAEDMGTKGNWHVYLWENQKLKKKVNRKGNQVWQFVYYWNVPSDLTPGEYTVNVRIKEDGVALASRSNKFNVIARDPVQETSIRKLEVTQTPNNNKLRFKAVVGYDYPDDTATAGVRFTIRQMDGNYETVVGAYDPTYAFSGLRGYPEGSFTRYVYNHVYNYQQTGEKAYFYKKNVGPQNRDQINKYIFKWPIPEDLPRGHEYRITAVITCDEIPISSWFAPDVQPRSVLLYIR